MTKATRFSAPRLIVIVFFLMVVNISPAIATLESGVPFATWVDGLTIANTYIEVPDDTKKLIVSITDGSGDLDLYMKYGNPVSGDTIEAIDANADIRSDGPDANESITLTAATSPPLRAGKWYIATLNLNSTRTYFTLTAYIEKDPDPIDFGIVILGQTADKTVRINNPGTSAIILNGIGISGPSADSFAVNCDCSTIQPGAYCDIIISYSPAVVGLATAQIDVYTNGGKIPSLSTTLSGYGVECYDPGLPLPTAKTKLPHYAPLVNAITSSDPASCRPIGVGSIANEGDEISIEVKLAQPSGNYDAYLALYAPAISRDDFFLLGSDGSFHAYSSSDLVKWKRNASTAIDEIPFGSFSTDSLPGGNYEFSLLLTPADTNRNFYLWKTGFSLPETNTEVPDGSVFFTNGTLTAPNAEILYGGQFIENSAPVNPDGLTTIKKNGNFYFYHPAMGQVELSEANSKLAVGYCMTGLPSNQLKESFNENTEAATKILRAVGDKINLDIGAEITLENKDMIISAVNNQRRFAVIKTSEEANNKYWLLPTSTTIPTELFELVSLVGSIDSGTYLYTSDRIEAFGAFSRLSQEFRMGHPNAVQLAAKNKDPQLVTALNALDMAYFTLEGIRQVTSLVIPTACSKYFINAFCRYLESVLAEMLSGDQNIVWKLDNTIYDGMVHDMLECACQAAAVGSIVGIPEAAAIEIADKFMSFIGTAQWLGEEVYENILAYFGSITPYDIAYVNISDMMGYYTVNRATNAVTEVVQNLQGGDPITVPGPQDAPHSIMAITPGGTVLSFWNSDTEHIVTTTNWGAGIQTDIGNACNLCGDRHFDPQALDISDAGRLVMAASQCWEEVDRYGHTKIIYRDGIFTSLEDGTGGHFIPIVLDQTEDDVMGYDSFEPRTISIAKNGQTVAFSAYEDGKYRLFTVDISGTNLQQLTTSNSHIDKIQLNTTGSRLIYDYTNAANQTELYFISTTDNGQVNLSALSGLTLFEESATISPDGRWIACLGGKLSNTDESTYGIALYQTESGSYHFVNLTPYYLVPPSHLPLSFTNNSSSVAFSAGDVSLSKDNQQYDIFLIDVVSGQANLRNLTNTAVKDEIFPVMGN